MNTGIQTSYWKFHSFRLDKANAILWHDDQVVPLRPRNFAALCYLIERHGQLVTKDELLDSVWQHRHVGESVLKVCINELRQALGDDARAPAYLVTVARRGYRFIAPVTQVHPSEQLEEPAKKFPAGIRRAPQSGARANWWIGRETAQAQLLAIWRHSLEGLRQIVFLTGEPGIGKTTLVEMFLNEVSDYAPLVFRMRCVEHFGQGEALLPMIEAIEKHCRMPEGAKLIELLHRHAPIWLAQLPSVLQPEEREALQREIFGASRERMIREGCELLETLSKDASLILVLEDLHWSDHATLDFLGLLARRSESAALLVLASYRPVDAALQAHSVALVHRELQLREISSEIAIDPFSPDEVRDYLIRRFPAMEMPDSLSRALFARTGGHPLFVSNLIEYLVSHHRQWPPSRESMVDKALPDTIRRVIGREIERLSPDEQRVLEIASVIGVHFSVILLGAVLDMETAEVDRSCDALVRRGQILLPDGMEQGSQGDVVGHYAFRHALYVEVLYQRLVPGQIIRLHLRIGECLEEVHGKSSLKHAAELALHFEKGWDWMRAVRYLTLSAANAAHRFANRQAYDYLVRALGLVHRLPAERQVETRVDLLKQSSVVRRSLGDIAGAKADLEEMLATARTSGSSRAEVLALIELSRVLVWLNRRQCLELAEQALARSKDLDDKILQSVVKGMWGGLNLLFGQWREDCASACREAMDVARAVATPQILHTRLTQHIYIELLASRYRSAWTTAEEALALSRTLGDGYMFIVGHYYCGLALLHLGEWQKLREIAEESRRAFESNCNDANLPLRLHRQIMMAWLHVEACDFAGAKAYCEEVPAENSGPWATYISAHFSAILGRALLGLGDHKGAIRCFEIFFQAEENESLPLSRNYSFPACQGACEAWLSLGEFGKARRYAQRLHDLAAGAPESTYLALSYSLFAEIAMKENILDEADSQIREALALVESTEVPLAAWRTYATAAKLHYLRGEERRANECELKKQGSVRKLLASLQDSDPLRKHLSSFVEMSTLRVYRTHKKNNDSSTRGNICCDAV
ncbi:transcriptional regulator [Nitrosospira lacus]|uniref:Transcriptional regulator n=1 Tax=Nitrosospira lacus TaxID=1288494 RepID=A0A1W6SQ28_9PROT|nr:AAA family ATPase [Nitrosospira lacus]ARO87899.1 transcriptional regulator [Nitrosospira lacus]